MVRGTVHDVPTTLVAEPSEKFKDPCKPELSQHFETVQNRSNPFKTSPKVHSPQRDGEGDVPGTSRLQDVKYDSVTKSAETWQAPSQWFSKASCDVAMVLLEVRWKGMGCHIQR